MVIIESCIIGGILKLSAFHLKKIRNAPGI